MRMLYTLPQRGEAAYRKVFQTEDNCTFDEWWGTFGIEQIAQEHGIAEYRELRIADVHRLYRRSMLSFPFELEGRPLGENEHRVFHWEKGHLYSCIFSPDTVYREEILYAHFQKRPIENAIRSPLPDSFWIVPNRTLEGSEGDVRQYLSSAEYEQEKRRQEKCFSEYWERFPDRF